MPRLRLFIVRGEPIIVDVPRARCVLLCLRRRFADAGCVPADVVIEVLRSVDPCLCPDPAGMGQQWERGYGRSAPTHATQVSCRGTEVQLERLRVEQTTGWAQSSKTTKSGLELLTAYDPKAEYRYRRWVGLLSDVAAQRRLVSYARPSAPLPLGALCRVETYGPAPEFSRSWYFRVAGDAAPLDGGDSGGADVAEAGSVSYEWDYGFVVDAESGRLRYSGFPPSC